MSAQQPPDEQPRAEPALRLVGEQPSPYDIITRQGVMEALWGILEDAEQEKQSGGHDG
ncbi:hypothetical protein [Curtobacterium flaccumfaciens]|uniref:hypothetical protein n=1 Tax=Curtobacterium flaccumfaciens TaxID=2035 RepID=UPI0038791F8A